MPHNGATALYSLCNRYSVWGRVRLLPSESGVCGCQSRICRSRGSKLALYKLPVLREELMNATVSILTEIPEQLHESLKRYLETHPDWDQDRVLTAALSLFLLQNGNSDRNAARVYLETLFHHS